MNGPAPEGVEYLDHTADVGLRARGTTLGEAIEAAARGLFALMVDLEDVRSACAYGVSVSAATPEELLVECLADLLAQKDVSGLVFSTFEVGVERAEGTYRLSGVARGEAIDRDRHRVGLEVKGISYLGLSAIEGRDGWVLECVLDV